ncbi:TM2 domain-containing protein [Oceanobacillus sp. FSL H7-0719]|uniref:TM2 domain-containing protein n=1 Tax=Oceanobacillus sp. FSL H7-0719 TaxID=2954507 RepID=UPI00324E1CE0
MQQKNIALAYVLWFFLGQIGIHRFYTGRIATGIMQLLLGVSGWATTWILIGYVPLGILWLWLLIDIFLIPGMCRNPR